MLKEKVFYNVKIKREVEQANGKTKKVGEQYLVEAVNVTDAETKINSYLKDDPFEWWVTSVTETNYLKVFEMK